MFKNFNFSLQTPTGIAQVVIGSLLLLNLVGAYFVMRPPGGSPEELREQVRSLTTQLRQKRAKLEITRAYVTKIQSGRQEGDQFLGQYFLPASKAYSTILSELIDLAKEAQMKPKESTWAKEPIEGSETFSTMTVTQNLEGTYPQLIHFVNALDKSSKLLIIESLQATPQSAGPLNVVLKVQTYVREDMASR